MRTIMILCGMALVCLTAAVYATDNYEYKRGEYALINAGMAPNLRYSIRANGSGELGYDNFHLYLMAEPYAKKIGPLTEIDEILDTGPQAYRARWSPDSTHVALTYRTDRHFINLLLYRIQKGRAFPVSRPPSLLNAVMPTKASFSARQRSHYFEVTWINSTRFRLHEQQYFNPSTPAQAKLLGNFGKSDKDEQTGEPVTYGLSFSAEAMCELLPNDKVKIAHIQPGKFM